MKEMSFDFISPKSGAKVQMTVSVKHVTEQENNLDGYRFTLKCDYFRYDVKDMIFNGEKIKCPRIDAERGQVIWLVNSKGRTARAILILPDDVRNEIFHDENEWIETVRKPAREKADEIERRYREQYNAVVKAMNIDK